MPGKNLSRFLRNEKARAQVLSGVVVALMILTAFTGLFLMSERASAATVVSEDFEDISDWTQNGTINLIHSTWTKHGGSYSVHLKDDNTSAYGSLYQDNTMSEGTCTIDYWVYYNSTTTIQGMMMLLNHTTADNYKLNLRIETNGTLCVNIKDDPSDFNEYYYGTSIPTGTWSHIIVILDSGNLHAYQDGTETINESSAITPDGEYTKVYVFSSLGDTNIVDMYIDDLIITDTADYPSASSLPSAPTGASATAYTKFDISLSGLDANSRITFPTAHTNDTSGAIVWANETSYGVLTISNDGIQQINLTWTKGTGATNTVIRRDTTSHAAWTLTTGSLLANITDNYYNIGSLSPGTHYYFALWSWNASGYSESYATCDAIVGNASVTNLTIHIEDVGSGTALVPKENFTLYGNASGGFVSLGSFDATTGNITLTTAYAGLPLAIEDKLYFEFKAAVGAGAQPDGTYYDANAQTLDCNVKAER